MSEVDDLLNGLRTRLMIRGVITRIPLCRDLLRFPQRRSKNLPGIWQD